ncbi:MAG: hypothetical protein C4532_06290 [Candidatus Abyssobacteria bacterium SURF_17]|uniref:Glycosyltransferase RgtA/B/C/D-like domain-containing protein n=1 Tax=Candidatus Abyssobacteria bacterium SURF_17 TaxID=2093361 RepID=A0A419F202_9BACT|nr:MAG: hypothetical protein C4532_06290 [Candidatus Abyssubacteria bacterium SURF_17]
MIKFLKRHTPLALAYLAITVLFTYPQILHMTTGCIEPPIGGSNDQYLLMWDAWWVKEALFDLKTSPYHTHLLNYPQGASLALSEIGVLNGILSAPFQFLVDEPHGLILGYNILIVFSFVATAIGMYALAFDISGSRAAAFIAGIGFAFMPYRALYVTTLNLLSTAWIPLYILFLSRTLRSPRLRNAAWSAIFFLLTLHSSFGYAFFLMLFSMVFVIAHLVSDYKNVLNKQVIAALAMVSGLCLIIVVPNMIMILVVGISWSQPVEVSGLLSANLVGYLFPSDQQVLFRFLFSFLPPFDYYISGVPGHMTFVSFTLVGLFIYGIVKTPRKQSLPWLIVFGFFLLLSLGPRLHFWSWETNIRLPYLLVMKYLPFSSAMRTPCRFVVLERIALIIIAAYGMKALFAGKADNPAHDLGVSWRRRVLLPGVLALLVAAELLHIPFRYVSADVPEIYLEISRSDKEFAVVDLPITRYRDIAKYMFYQTVHQKPIPIGIVNRPEAGLEDTTGGILSILRSIDEITPQLLDALRDYGAGYVIMHEFQDGADHVTVHELLPHGSS